MRKLLPVLVSVLFLGIGAAGLAHEATTTEIILSAKPGILPSSFFYFLDRFGETIREFLAFNPEAKVKLQVAFAAERVAEIEAILEVRGVDAPGLDVAKARLQAHMERAKIVLEREKSKGKDISKLSHEVEDAFDLREEELEAVFEEREKALEAKEEIIEDQLEVAKKAGDQALMDQLEAELVKIEEEKEKLEREEEALEEQLEKEEGEFEDALEIEDELDDEIDDELEEVAEDLEDLEGELKVEIEN